jgi:5-methylphenazine-1-carboxylate 1-monooxygenase
VQAQGRALINWVATLQTAAAGRMPRQDWTYIARREEALAAFASFDFDFLDVPALIRGAKVVYQYSILVSVLESVLDACIST